MKVIAGLSVPTAWDDVSFGDYCRMFASVTDDMTNEEKTITMVCDVLNITPSILSDMKVNDVSDIIASFGFVGEQPKATNEPIVIDGKRYIAPLLDEMTYKQYIDIESSYNEISPYDISAMAACLFVEAGAGYKAKQTEFVESELKKLPAPLVVGNVLSFIEKKKGLLRVITTLQDNTETAETTAKQ